MLLENYNVLSEQGPIATKTNKFEGETKVYSFHYYTPLNDDPKESDIVPENWFPFDIMYKSTSKGEHYYMVYTTTSRIYSNGSVTINLNGNTNIKLKRSFSEEFTIDEFYEILPNAKNHKDVYEDFCENCGEERYFFEIKKEDLLKCCQASSISVLVKKDDTNIENEYDDVGSVIPPIFKAIYNKTADSSKFPESINDMKEWYMKEEKENIEIKNSVKEEGNLEDLKEYIKENKINIGCISVLIIALIVFLVLLFGDYI